MSVKILLIVVMIGFLIPLLITDASAYTISNDSTGGDCSSMGTWNSATKTCALSNNLTEGIVIGSNGITLDGNGYTINGNNAGTGILIDTKTVITITNINIRNFDTGINLNNVVDIKISKNKITNNVGVGVSTGSSNQIKIIENNIENNNYGLNIYGTHTYEVSKNQISNNHLDGIDLGHGGSYSDVIRENTISNNNRNGISSTAYNIEVTNNIITGNTENGIYVDRNGLIISKNLISNNKNSGISVHEYASVEFFGNTIQENNYGISGSNTSGYNNNFVNNAKQISAATERSSYREPPIGGNYWSDFSPVCLDADFNNFCDKPYPFNRDNFPWLVQNGWLTSFNLPSNVQINALDSSGATVNYSVSATHDGNHISVTCNPASSSLFPIGETVVLCTANNGVFSKFNVIVKSADIIPSTDTDGDGIPDSSDSCPTKDETVNGYADTDGCPDVSPEIPIPPTNPNEVRITPASGSGAPGCEETSQGCYLPKSVSVNVGGLVEFSNTDTAAHTFTAGTAADGPSGEFDTGLLLAGSSYEWTPETAGEFPYHCMVHPWMEGTITIVNSNINNNTTKIVTLPVMVGDKKFSVTSKITGTSITKISTDLDFMSVTLDVITMGNPGILEITFERSFFDSISEGYDDDFIVLADGDEPKYSEIKTTDQSRTLRIELHVGTEEVEIIGSQLGQTIHEPVKEEPIAEPHIPPTTDDLPYEIKITPTPGSGAPGCEETSQGCFIPKVASVTHGGKVIFSNTDTAAHTFTAGTAVDGPSGVFDTSLVIAGSSYEWTATKAGEIPYYCMVHPWREGILFVGKSPYPIPEPEPELISLNLVIEPKVYDIGNIVSLKMSLEGVSSPHDIGIDISDVTGKTIISRSVTTSSSGAATIDFKIAENFKAGTYHVVATASVDGKTLKETTQFIVKSQYNQFKITSVQSTDQQGKLAPLKAGEVGFIKVNLESNKSITTLVTVNLFDSDLTSIGIGSVKTTLSSGNSEIILSFMIPKDAALGPADIYVNAFSDWPSNNGIPLTKEFAIQENIQ